MERPSWQEYFTTIVQYTSSRSPCSRLKVGCLIVKNNRIIAQGYNGFLPGLEHKSCIVDNHELATIHAEQNALMDCAKRGVSCDDCVAYHVDKAKKLGAVREELVEILAVAIEMRGGPAVVYAAKVLSHFDQLSAS